MPVKDPDKIIKTLKERGCLVSASQIQHSQPSWFMRVEQMQEKLLEENAETYWVTDSIKEGRVANWLRDARDWNLSRLVNGDSYSTQKLAAQFCVHMCNILFRFEAKV